MLRIALLPSVVLLVMIGCHTKTSITIQASAPYRHTEQVGLPEDVRAVLEQADSLELMALDPRINAMRIEDGDRPTGESLHEYEILGRCELEGTERRSAVEAIYQGIVESDGTVAGCFNPRHGVRATKAGSTVDLVICFECLQLLVYLNDTRVDGVLTTQHAKRVLTPMLNQRGIQIHRGH